MSEQRLQHFKFIEASLAVLNSVTVRQLAAAFSIPEDSATKAILDYKENVFPLLFDIRLFKYVPRHAWSPKILKSNPHEFLRAAMILSPDLKSPALEEVVMSNNDLPCYSAKEIVEMHNKCMKPQATEEEKRALLDKFDITKNRIALITYDEKENHPSGPDRLAKTRQMTLTLIEMHWREYFTPKEA